MGCSLLCEVFAYVWDVSSFLCGVCLFGMFAFPWAARFFLLYDACVFVGCSFFCLCDVCLFVGISLLLCDARSFLCDVRFCV